VTKALVGGMIEVIVIDDSKFGPSELWCNEEFLYEESCWVTTPDGERFPKRNALATHLCEGRANMGPLGIVGDTFLTGWADDEGDITEVAWETVRYVNRIAGVTGLNGARLPAWWPWESEGAAFHALHATVGAVIGRPPIPEEVDWNG